MGKRKDALAPISVESVLRVAEIFGRHSAAAKALDELLVRRARGEDVCLYEAPGCLVVGPVIATPSTVS